MDAKFHRDQTAKIYAFVPAVRPAPSERVEPRLFSADIVPMRADTRQAPLSAPPISAPASKEPALPYADFGSGWYHDVAIGRDEPSKH